MCTSYLYWPWPQHNLFPRSCLTWILSIRNVTQRLLAVFPLNYSGMCTMSWVCAVYFFYIWWDDLFEFVMKFRYIEKCPFTYYHITFRFRTASRRRIAVFLETLQVRAPSHGGVLYSFWYWWDVVYEFVMNFLYIEKYPFTCYVVFAVVSPDMCSYK